MVAEPDYSILDHPKLLEFIFYPRHEWTPLPSGAKDYMVPVEEGISVSCRFYPLDKNSPCILFFHGNGEVACDYDWIAPIYNDQGISLFVADYRGYGRSGGKPTFSSTVKDAHAIFKFFSNNVEAEGRLFIMGRSLGTNSALEIAYHYSESLSGLIVESGAANMTRLLTYLGLSIEQERVKELEEAIAAKISAIALPALILHGESDNLIPAREAMRLYNALGSKDKQVFIIPGVGHNDIMIGAMEEYFSSIAEFIFAHTGS